MPWAGGAWNGPLFRAAASAGTSAAGTSLAVNVPAGVVDGDMMVFGIAIRGGTGVTLLALADWTPLALTPTSQSTNVQMGVWWRIASSEPASYTATWTGTFNAAAGIYAASKCSSVNTSAAQANAASASVTAPSITAPVGGSLLLFIGGMSAGATFTAPPTMFERIDVVSTAGATNASIEFAEEPFGSSGATGTRVATSTASGGNIGALLALQI